MLYLLKIREIQLGIIIFIVSFFTLLFSEADVNMTVTHGLLITISSVLLITLVLQVNTLLLTPKENRLKILLDSNKYRRLYNVMFFFIYFTIITIIIGLISEALGNNRSYNILLISMFMTNLYNLLISTMITFNIIKLSETKYDN